MNQTPPNVLHAKLIYTLPLPGRGGTLERWRQLALWAARDIALAKLLEAHYDALAIMCDLNFSIVGRELELWGVWAAEEPAHTLVATHGPDGWRLRGTKPWCSGFHACTRALITVQSEGHATADALDGNLLMAVDLRHPSIAYEASGWSGPDTHRSPTAIASFTQTPATLVAPASDYINRPGFWHRGAGVAACWWGATAAVAGTLQHRLEPDRPNSAARLGRVAARVLASQHAVRALAAQVDANPCTPHAVEVLALRLLIKHTALDTIDEVNDILGPAGLSADHEHAQRCADLNAWVRKNHTDVDDATLGRLVYKKAPAWEL